MDIETTDVDGTDEGTNDDGARTRLDRRNKKLSDENKGLRDRLAKLEEAEAERQAERERAEQEQARKDKNWEKIEADYKKRLGDAEKEAADLRAAEQARVEASARDVRQRAFLDRVKAKCGAIPEVRLRGLMREASAGNEDLILDPENPTEGDVKRMIAELKSLDPDSFEGRQTVGGTRGSPPTGRSESLEEIAARVEREGGWTPETKTAYAQALNEAKRPKS